MTPSPARTISTSVTIAVSGEDLLPGAYEAVVVAPELSAASYRLSARLPAVSVASVGTGPSATFRNPAATVVKVTARAALVGAVRREEVRGTGADALDVETEVPSWATKIVVDVALPIEMWHRLTDFGVTVFDSTGARRSDSPMNYAFGRHTLELDEGDAGSTLTIELFPAFAHLDPPDSWTAEVQISYVAAEPIALPALGYSTVAELELALEDTGWLRLTLEGAQDFTREGIRKITELAQIMARKNPLINHAVDVTSGYVFGQGVETGFEDDRLNDVWQAFWQDGKNKKVLTGHRARIESEQELEVTGNLFLPLFTHMATGRVRCC